MGGLGGGRARFGLPVTQEQVDELKAHQDDINYEVAEARGERCATM